MNFSVQDLTCLEGNIFTCEFNYLHKDLKRNFLRLYPAQTVSIIGLIHENFPKFFSENDKINEEISTVAATHISEVLAFHMFGVNVKRQKIERSMLLRKWRLK